MIFITAEAALVSSFLQSDSQSRTPEATFKVSDPESINRKKLTAWILCKRNICLCSFHLHTRQQVTGHKLIVIILTVYFYIFSKCTHQWMKCVQEMVVWNIPCQKSRRHILGCQVQRIVIKTNWICVQIYTHIQQADKPGRWQALRIQAFNTILLKEKKKKEKSVQQLDIFNSSNVVLSKHFHTILNDPIFALLCWRGYEDGMV